MPPINRPIFEGEGEPLIYDAEFHNFHKDRLKRKRRCRFCIALLISLCILALLIFGLVFLLSFSVYDTSNSVLGSYKHAAVAADVGICSDVGRDIMLKQGGNGVDAAIATLLCLGVADAQSMGIGGGFFMVIYDKSTDKTVTIDAREVAPINATEDMFVDNQEAARKGPLSIAVPGEIKGYWKASQDFGVLPWKELFQPAIKMCMNGFKVPGSLSDALQEDKKEIEAETSLKEIFTNPATGQLYKEGEIMKREQLGRTYKTIAEEGMDSFYTGNISKELLADLEDVGSIITAEDLQNYEALRKDTLTITLNNGYRVYSPPPPASGAVLSFILNILDGYNFIPEDLKSNNKRILFNHRMVESFKFAYAKRTDLGDEAFVNVTQLVANLTSKAYANYIRSKIYDNTTFNYMYYGPTFYDQFTTSTSHVSLVDKYGNGVAVTSTVNARFGSKLRGRRTGIIFNNEMDDFSSPNVTNEFGIRPSPANFIKPGKRPLSSMCPMIAVDGNGVVQMVLGAAGGSKITTATAFTAAHHLWLGLDIKQSIDARRLHHQLLPPYIQYETGYRKYLIDGLVAKGHNVTEVELGKSIVQGVTRKNNMINANCDFRKGGYPSGF